MYNVCRYEFLFNGSKDQILIKKNRIREIKCDLLKRNILICGKVYCMFGRIFFYYCIGYGEGGFELNEFVNISIFIIGIYIFVIII